MITVKADEQGFLIEVDNDGEFEAIRRLFDGNTYSAGEGGIRGAVRALLIMRPIDYRRFPIVFKEK